MKHKLSITAVALLTASSLFALPEPIARWNADGDVQPEPGGKARTTKSVEIAYRAGVAGKAFNFDGTTSEIETDLVLKSSETPTTTWSVWIKPTESAGQRQILSADPYFHSLFITDGKLSVHAGQRDTPVAPVKWNVWQHVAVVFAPDHATVYHRGGTATIPFRVEDYSQNRIFIGGCAQGISRYSGLIDEIAIYDRELSKAEIAEIATRPDGAKRAALAKPTPKSPEKSGFPVQRVLTDSAGRKLDATILEKTADSIKCRRTSDNKEFTLQLTNLSADDRKFLAELDKSAVAKPAALAPTPTTTPPTTTPPTTTPPTTTPPTTTPPTTTPTTKANNPKPDPTPPAPVQPAKPAAAADKPSKMPFLYWLTQIRVSQNFKIIGREEAGYKIKFLQDGREEIIPCDRLEMIKRVKILGREESGYKLTFLDEQNPDLEIIVPFDQLTEADRKFLTVGPPEIKPGFVWGTPSNLPFYYYLTLNVGGQKELRVPATISSRAVNGYNVYFQPGGPPIPGKPTGTECIVTFNEISKKDREALKWIDDAPPHSIPCLYTLTLPGGKSLTGTITKKGPVTLKVIRASDNKEVELQISKLTTRDRKVVDGIPDNNNGTNVETLPLQIELTLKTGKKLEVTILKRTGKDFSSFTCKKTSDGKEVTIGFHELAAGTQNELALIHTTEPTTFPAICWLMMKTPENPNAYPHFLTVTEKTDTEIKALDANQKPITISISDLDDNGRKLIDAPTRTITGVPRRFKHDFTMPSSPIVVPAGEAVWVRTDNSMAMWLAEDMRAYYRPKEEIGTPRKVDYEIVITDKDKEYRIPPGETIRVIKETTTSMTILEPYRYAATITIPAPGTKTVSAPSVVMTADDDRLPNLADPPFVTNDTKQ